MRYVVYVKLNCDLKQLLDVLQGRTYDCHICDMLKKIMAVLNGLLRHTKILQTYMSGTIRRCLCIVRCLRKNIIKSRGP